MDEKGKVENLWTQKRGNSEIRKFGQKREEIWTKPNRKSGQIGQKSRNRTKKRKTTSNKFFKLKTDHKQQQHQKLSKRNATKIHNIFTQYENNTTKGPNTKLPKLPLNQTTNPSTGFFTTHLLRNSIAFNVELWTCSLYALPSSKRSTSSVKLCTTPGLSINAQKCNGL